MVDIFWQKLLTWTFFSASPFSLLFSLSQKVALILLFFWVGFFQRISALFSSCVRCWKGQQVLPFSQTLDIRENRKWQKVWAPLSSFFFAFVHQSLWCPCCTKQKTVLKGEKKSQITSHRNNPWEKSGHWKKDKNLVHFFFILSGKPTLGTTARSRYFMFMSDLVCPLSFFLVGKNPIQASCPITKILNLTKCPWKF